MTTVLAVYNSEGCVGRCDAKCHEATTRECDCICGGRNHGIGVRRALDQTRADIERMAGPDALARFESHHRVGATRVEAGADVVQLNLDIGP